MLVQLLLFFMFAARFVMLCDYFDTEEWPMAEYFELKHINQSNNQSKNYYEVL